MKIYGKNSYGEVVESEPQIGQIFKDHDNNYCKLVSLTVIEPTDGVYTEDKNGVRYLSWLNRLIWIPTMSDLPK
jgi:hypothetical protein